MAVYAGMGFGAAAVALIFIHIVFVYRRQKHGCGPSPVHGLPALLSMIAVILFLGDNLPVLANYGLGLVLVLSAFLLDFGSTFLTAFLRRLLVR
jgi:hypothetical protein